MWLRFTRAFRWRVRASGAVVIRYPAGMVVRVTRPCAAAAIAAGAASPAANPKARKRARPEPPLGKAPDRRDDGPIPQMEPNPWPSLLP